MDLLLLAGNSKRGKAWLEQVDASLAPQFEQTVRHDYTHWEHDRPEIDLDHEAQRLIAVVQDLAPYAVFAKSAGTMLASKAAAQGILQPTTALFVGLPLIMIRDHGLPIAEWLRKTDFPITILQHTADPFGSYQEVYQCIRELGRDNITVRELPGDTHDYFEFEAFKSLVEST